MNTTDGIEISYRNTISDHIHASRVYDASNRLAKIDMLVSLLLVACAAWAVYVGEVWLGIIWFAIAAVESFTLFLIRSLHVYVSFKTNPKFSEDYHITFDDEGMVFKTKTIDSRIAWSFYTKLIKSPRVFLLVYGKGMYSIIPKSAFSDEAQINAFKDLAERKIISNP